MTTRAGDAMSRMSFVGGRVVVDKVPAGQAPATDHLAVVHRLDDVADRALDLLRGRPRLDHLVYLLSESGNFSVLWHVVAWTPWVVRPSAPRLRRAAAISAGLAVESVLVNGPIKSRFRRQRPETAAARPHRLRQPRTSSFPSGHASAAMVAAALLSRGRPSLRPHVYTGAAAMSLSRVYVRLHHASDVAGGVALGYVLGRVLGRALDPLITRRPTPR
jgi:undecaprenyl-diphosphatase